MAQAPSLGRVWAAALVVFVASAAASIQVRFNAEMLVILHNPAEVAVINQSIQVAIASVVLVAAVSRRRAWGRLFSGLRSRQIRWWEILGGLCGAYFISMQAVAGATVGVAIFAVAVVTGQTSAAAAVDRVGLGPAGRQQLSLLRALAIVVAIAAVIVPMWQRIVGSEGSGVLVVSILALVAGAVVAVQLALNARVAVHTGQPFVAAWTNFAVGVIGMSVVLVIAHLLSGWQIGALPAGKLWLLAGPLFGLIFIVSAAWAVPIVGVLVTSLMSVAGQLLGALLTDLIAPTAGVVVNPALLLGVLLAFIAAVLAAFGRRPRMLEPGRV